MDRTAPDRLMRHAGFVIHKAGQRGLHIFNRGLASLEIDVRHYAVLSTVEHEPHSQIFISEALRIDRSSLVQLVDELEKRNLLRRLANPEDRRAHLITITPSGRKLVALANALATESDKEFLAPLAPKERKFVLDLLTKLI